MSRTGKPKPPPFPAGARVKYTGFSITYEDGRSLKRGDVGVVIATRPGRQGTGRPLPPDEHDDETYYDETRDGRSIVQFPGGVERAVSPPLTHYRRVKGG